jgi:hypothetical protein
MTNSEILGRALAAPWWRYRTACGVSVWRHPIRFIRGVRATRAAIHQTLLRDPHDPHYGSYVPRADVLYHAGPSVGIQVHLWGQP